MGVVGGDQDVIGGQPALRLPLHLLRDVVQPVRAVLVRGEHPLRLDVGDRDDLLLLREDDRAGADPFVDGLALPAPADDRVRDERAGAQPEPAEVDDAGRSDVARGRADLVGCGCGRRRSRQGDAEDREGQA
jgi:hypothetical protein